MPAALGALSFSVDFARAPRPRPDGVTAARNALPGETARRRRRRDVTPLLDQIMHHAHLLEFEGKSRRRKEAAAGVAKRANSM
jgi:hypothetical protein